MMGTQGAAQEQLFYSFSLDAHVPPDHLLRGVDRFLDLSSLREYLAPFYSHTGGPSIDPELMIRMLVIGYCFGIRSERRLCEEALLRRCMKEGLIGGECFAIDASVIKADANRSRGSPAAEWSAGDAPSRAVREYLQALWTAAPGGPAFYAYSTNYLIDLDAGIILEVEATPAHRTYEVESTKIMIERVEQQLKVRPRRLMVNEKRIEPHIPVWEKSKREDGTFSTSDFRFDSESNAYVCLGGKQLTTTGRVTNAATILFRAASEHCAACEHKQRCCPNTPHRRIDHSVYEEARDAARTVCNTPAYERSRTQRKKVEMLFAHLKRILKLDRTRPASGLRHDAPSPARATFSTSRTLKARTCTAIPVRRTTCSPKCRQ